MIELEVLEENWEAVQAFGLCQQSWIGGMAGGVALGFSAQEISAACRLLGIARDLLATVAVQLREMGAAAAEALNARKRG